MYPQADIFTLFYDPDAVSETIQSRRVVASYLNPMRRWHRSLLPFMPSALESFDLRGYDLVISSESGPAKGVLTSSQSVHVCYCHTPMRYLWERMKIVVEPTGALGAAALFEGRIDARGKRVGIIISGGNVDFKSVSRLL